MVGKVLVLMSTWNGVRFLKEQLDSISAQSFNGELHLLVRDDGSNDGTLEVLERYEGVSITICRGKNIGAKASFLELIRLAHDYNFDFYALSDQDDVWCAGKITAGVDKIKHLRKPALYCTSLELVDQELHHLSRYTHSAHHCFASTLVSNYVTGCTCVFNRMLLERIRLPKKSEEILMHDWWIGLTAAHCAEVFYDCESNIKYRQHGGNLVGMQTGFKGFVRRLQRCFQAKTTPTRITQARSFEEAYRDELSESTKSVLRCFCDYSGTFLGRLKYVYRIRSYIRFASAVRFVLFS